MKPTQIEKLKDLRPCYDAVIFAEKFPTLQQAWDACERGDWMLWLLGKLSGSSHSKSHKQLVFIACQCARLALKYVPECETRPFVAIDTTEKWTRGEATLKQVKAAADAAAAAAYADAAAAYAAAAAAYAAYAADAAAAYAAAYVAAYVAAHVATAAVRTKTLKQCAEIVRKYHPVIKL